MIDHRQRIHSRLARWSGRLALFFTALALTGVVLHRLTSFPTPVAINLFAVSAAGLVLAIVLGLLSLIGIWRKGYAGAGCRLCGYRAAAPPARLAVGLSAVAFPAAAHQ